MTAVVVSLTTVFGTGGIAVAGGFPPPIQEFVADAARALPIPLSIPYPKVTIDQVAFEVKKDVAQPVHSEDIVPGPYVPTPTRASVPAGTETGADRTESAPADQGEEVGPEVGCDVRDEVVGDDRAEQRAGEAHAEARGGCGLVLTDPPTWPGGKQADQDRR
jgi:hypothetical protein